MFVYLGLMTVHTIDLHFLGQASAIAAFAIPDARGYALVECGPFSTHESLIAGLRAKSIDPDDVHTLLLTHIHFDHAGAAWWWARKGAQVYVHPRGLRHMIDPTRLYGSAARIYGEDRMEELWGRMEAIDAASITGVEDRVVLPIGGKEWTAHHTPGHASHHIAWAVDGVVFTGDVGGVSIHGGPVVPPLPPPDIDVPAWCASIERLERLNARAFYLTHFGKVAPGGHLPALRRRLTAYVDWVAGRIDDVSQLEDLVPGFSTMVEDELRAAGADELTIKAYRAANPPYMSVTGIARYLKTKDA